MKYSGQDIFDDTTPEPGPAPAPAARARFARRGTAAPAPGGRTSTPREAKPRKSLPRAGRKLGDGEQMALTVVGVIILGALYGSFSDSPAGQRMREIPASATGMIGGTWDWFLSLRPGHIPAEKRASVEKKLSRLAVADEVDVPGYTREQFGAAWRDTDHNGCDQRNDVLRRDLTRVTRSGRCVVTGGVLTDPYDGTGVRFTKADPSGVQIDHIVALAAAWREGAADWSPARREKYANDRANLIAASANTNRDKSDKDAADWSPDGDARQCSYARKVVSIKVKWGLTVDKDESEALGEMLGRCA